MNRKIERCGTLSGIIFISKSTEKRLSKPDEVFRAFKKEKEKDLNC